MQPRDVSEGVGTETTTVWLVVHTRGRGPTGGAWPLTGRYA